jgi:hypothetical protein
MPNDAGDYAVGASWKTDGNSDADAQVQRLLAEAARENWAVRFAWRDHNAWESDWSSDAAAWVNAVDLAYYAGHAYASGWELADPQTGDALFLKQRTVGIEDATQRLLWGSKLKWILVSACGPLEDRCAVPSIDNVFNWSGAFDGLRLIVGFASATSGFSDEGARTFQLARRGIPIARAWLRAARETQPSVEAGETNMPTAPRWAAVLALEGRNGSSLDDHLPDRGRPLVDLTGANTFRAIWTPT